ncbi:hypothetical protein Pcinc_020873 [Petrolisthes cinctipes]|uniref:C2H2-type domain-containing protein n=1 Tax=Petrolisthes cinctipes TaxID=88211 RepID=A0AAE1KIG2_PETCI|nr:hypothetical protein Pcinc_027136 [Petrolisthes cinctipes]KAK3874164.1 hypothetical protein Pcinc_020873 [Petrolisthes cinctipes]
MPCVSQARRLLDFARPSWASTKSSAPASPAFLTPKSPPLLSPSSSSSSSSPSPYLVGAPGTLPKGNVLDAHPDPQTNLSLKTSSVIESRQTSWPEALKVVPVTSESEILRAVALSKLSPVSHRPSRDPLECPWCHKVLSKASNLKVHMRCHTGEKPYHCLFCPYTAAQKIQVINHMNARHQNSPINFS